MLVSLITILVSLFLILLALSFMLLPLLRGVPFIPTPRKIVEKMILLADLKPGMKGVDLGSGDGRIVIALAEAGIEGHGFEINPMLVWWSRRNIKKKKLSGRAFIHWGNFWRYDFSTFDVITVYGITSFMKELEKKLEIELKPGARVVSYAFKFPNWPHTRQEDKIYLYVK